MSDEIKKDTEVSQNGKNRSGSFSAKRRQALVTYLAALFGVAFLVVLISLIVQLNSGSNPVANTSAEKVEALQEQVKSLQEENASLLSALAEQSDDATAQQLQEYQDQVRQLQEIIIQMSEANEYLESNSHDVSSSEELLTQQLKALKLLSAAQMAYIKEDADAVREAMGTLQDEELYVYLEGDHLNAYYLIIEYMEQPYFGQ